ncbi:MAG: carbamate kinase [Bacillota bacterium]|jgi:carbamate kinase
MTKGAPPKRLVVALGGNAILQPGEKGTFEEQDANVLKTCRQIAKILKKGHEVVITHGNGPQVGNILIQNERSGDVVPSMPLDVCGSESQGFIGYMIQNNMNRAMAEEGIHRDVATVVTQVVVDPKDPAFDAPTKPVGPFYDSKTAASKMKERGERWVEDSGRGWRKVVPSPDPLDIVEKQVIKVLLEAGILVVACGGGGIPVVAEGGAYRGVEAVIDKDLAAERLASMIRADMLLILTDVPRVCLNYRQPGQMELGQVTVKEARDFMNQGHFKAGSMKPKVQAAIRFVESGGKAAIISSLGAVLDAIDGLEGTRVVPGI